MAKSHDEWLTDEEVEAEIERLKGSEAVKLARKKIRLEYRHRQVLYSLRNLEKRGKELMAAGITSEMLDQMYSDESLSSEEV